MGWLVLGWGLMFGGQAAVLWLVMSSRSVARTTDEG